MTFGPNEPKTPFHLRRHAIKRAKERYELSLSSADIKDISSLIKSDDRDKTKIKFLCKQSNRISHWKVFYKEQWILVVYDKNRNTVVSFLPKDVPDDYYERHTQKQYEKNIKPVKRDKTMGGFLPAHWTEGD